MAAPGGDECVPLLEAALERGGKLAFFAFSVCPALEGGHGPGSPGLYLAAWLGRVPSAAAYHRGGVRAGGDFSGTGAHGRGEL